MKKGKGYLNPDGTGGTGSIRFGNNIRANAGANIRAGAGRVASNLLKTSARSMKLPPELQYLKSSNFRSVKVKPTTLRPIPPLSSVSSNSSRNYGIPIAFVAGVAAQATAEYNRNKRRIADAQSRIKARKGQTRGR